VAAIVQQWNQHEQSREINRAAELYW
jgi:hypothetical protein